MLIVGFITASLCFITSYLLGGSIVVWKKIDKLEKFMTF
jgi:hypothetical protein